MKTYFLALVVVIISFATLDYFIAVKKCNVQYSDFERSSSFFAPCQIKVDGVFIPASNYRKF